MKVRVNSKEVETEAQNISELLGQLSLPERGIAVAVEGQMVPRAEWSGYALKEGARLIIIKAVCGG